MRAAAPAVARDREHLSASCPSSFERPAALDDVPHALGHLEARAGHDAPPRRRRARATRAFVPVDRRPRRRAGRDVPQRTVALGHEDAPRSAACRPRRRAREGPRPSVPLELEQRRAAPKSLLLDTLRSPAAHDGRRRPRRHAASLAVGRALELQQGAPPAAKARPSWTPCRSRSRCAAARPSRERRARPPSPNRVPLDASAAACLPDDDGSHTRHVVHPAAHDAPPPPSPTAQARHANHRV